MTEPSPAIVGETLVYDGWMRVVRADLRMPDGAVVERHFEDHGAAVAVLLYDPARRTARLVSQPRSPVIRAGAPALLEVVAGGMEPCGAEATVRKEALDEAGVAVGALEFIATIWSMPSVSTERLDLFLAPYDAAAIVGKGGGAEDENEGITVHDVPLATLARMAAAGRLQDAKTLILIQTLQLRHPELFD